MDRPEDKVRSYDEALNWRNKLKESGKKLVITNGCFDLLHRGHVQYLNEAREEGDALLVAINSDSSLTALKGPERPIVKEQDRAYMLASLASVDCVVIFPDINCVDLLSLIPPDVYVKGGDYTVDTINRDEYDVLKDTGCSFAFIDFVEGLSTSSILEKLKQTGS